MEEIVDATECPYDGLVIDEKVIHILDTLEIVFERDVGEIYNDMYTEPRALHGIIGFECEVGEIKDAIKKSLFYRKDLDIVNIFEEIGDCLYFVVILEKYSEDGNTLYGTRDLLNRLAEHYGGSLDACEQMVVEKLKKRYPSGFSTEAATKRDLAAERKALES